MPRISVIVPAYNVAAYLERCLESLKAQQFEDWEAIVVDDCSTDASGAIADSYAQADQRFHVIHHSENRGLHLARKTGVEAATGDYIMFLDGDDELTPGCLGQLAKELSDCPSDVLMFGLEAMGENGTPESAVRGFEQWSNGLPCDSSGRDVIDAAFIKYSCPWHVTQSLVSSSVAHNAFEMMSSNRLERAEDAYEFMVIASLSDCVRGIPSVVAYRYHMGSGVTNAGSLASAKFAKETEAIRKCVDAMQSYSDSQPQMHLSDAVVGLRCKVLESIGNDWNERVSDEEKDSALDTFADAFGPAAAARELWRFVRDRAYHFVAAREFPPADDRLYLLRSLAERTEAAIDPTSADRVDYSRERNMRARAETHLTQITHAEHVADFDSQDIRILVTTHKNVVVPKSEILQPIQVGPGNKSNRFDWALHDDEGENISKKNPMYCELTTQYWAWKNTTSPYVGFCHYRRYFNFTSNVYEENPYGEVMDDFIDAEAVRRYGLDDATIRSCVEGYDVITTGFKCLADFPGDFSTPREHYAAAPALHIEDLNRCAAIVHRLFPDYAQDFDAFLAGERSCFCNMYIMRREIFSSYCEFLFPVLDEFVRETDMTTYSREAVRTPGHLAERLFNVWFMHAMRTGEGGAWKTKQLQCVHFEHPEPERAFTPVFVERESVLEPNVVPVVFASDDAYVPVLTVAIESMLRNANPERFYDVVVLTRNITWDHQVAMREYLGRYSNARLTFMDVWRKVAGYDLDTNNEHISIETYYRFLVQDVLSAYDKVLYLDSDLVVEGDVAELFDTELGDNLVGATRDVDYLANLNLPDGNRMRYSRGVLKMKNPYDYFQAGVLVLNTRAMRKLHAVSEWLRVSQRSDFIYNDQDVLNSECEGRVTYLDASWNVTNDIFHRATALYPNAPAAAYDAYLASRNNPKIVHYAGAAKPWTYGWIDLSDHFWNYARETPFYEAILAGLSKFEVRQSESHVMSYIDNEYPQKLHELVRPPRAVGEDNPIRQIVDPIAPVGSARREVLKSIGRGLRGRK